MQVLKQSTTATILVGPVLDADGAAYTSAVIGDFNITKNGSTAALAASATATHSHNGMYLIALTTGNTDTLGRLDISLNKSTYGMTNHRYEVLSANQFDALVTNGSVTPAAIADQVYEEAYAGHTTPGTYGFLWDKWRKSNPAITGEVTSAVTPTTTQFSTDITGYGNGAFENAVLVFINGSTNADFRGVISGYLQSNGVVTITPALPQPPVPGDEFTIAIPSFVYTLAQVQSGLATTAQLTTVENKVDAIDDFVDTEVAAIKATTDKLDTTVELDGAVYRFTTNALEQAPSGGGGGTSIMVTPVVAQTPVRVVGTNIETFIGDLSDIRVGIFSGTDPVDLSGFGDLEVCVQERDGTDLDLVPMADLTIDGDSNEYVTWTPNGPSVSQVRRGKWSLRKTSNKQVIGYGSWIVVDAALGDGS